MVLSRGCAGTPDALGSAHDHLAYEDSALERLRLATWLAATLALGGCVADEPMTMDGDEPLSDLDALLMDSPSDRGRGLPADGKADEVIPEQFDLIEYQTSIRSQGR